MESYERPAVETYGSVEEMTEHWHDNDYGH